MGKIKAAESAIARPAKYLQSYDVTMIRRKLQLKAFKSRVESLLEKLEGKLNPHVEAELQGQSPTCTKLVVEVGKAVVEIGRTDRTSPQYKKILDQFADEAEIDVFRNNPDYVTASSQYRTKLMGNSYTVDQLLHP